MRVAFSFICYFLFVLIICFWEHGYKIEPEQCFGWRHHPKGEDWQEWTVIGELLADKDIVIDLQFFMTVKCFQCACWFTVRTNQNDKFDVCISTAVSGLILQQSWCWLHKRNLPCVVVVYNITPVRDCRWSRSMLPSGGCKGDSWHHDCSQLLDYHLKCII